MKGLKGETTSEKSFPFIKNCITQHINRKNGLETSLARLGKAWGEIDRLVIEVHDAGSKRSQTTFISRFLLFHKRQYNIILNV